MSLFIFHKCHEKIGSLPSAIIKKVYDFLVKFKENSKAAAIHLEPIKTFRDQTLRSARIDQTYRAIIKVSSSGQDFHLLWVDHHDKAYEWAQNKIVDYNKITNSWQVITEVEDVRIDRDSLEDTSTQGLFDVYEDSQLLDIGLPQILIPAVRAIKNWDELDSLSDYLPEGVFENLFYLLDGGEIEGIISEIKEASKLLDGSSDQSILDKRSFLKIPDDKLLYEALSGDMLKWKHYLHESQALVVNKNYKGSFKLSGGAGTGKTVAALHRLKVLSKEKTGNQKVLFTTYTKSLTDNLNLLAEAIEVKMSNVEITNIDSVAFQLALKANLISKNDKILGITSAETYKSIWEEILQEEIIHYEIDFLTREIQDVLLLNNVRSLPDYLKVNRLGRGKALGRIERRELWAILEIFTQRISQKNILFREEVFNRVFEFYQDRPDKPYSNVIVDELQDLSNVELRFLRAIVPEGENDLFLVGDPMQAIYQRNLNFSKAGINIRGIRSKRLRINYRTTEEIRRVAVKLVTSQTYDDFEGEQESKSGYISLMHGVNPSYDIFRTPNEELNYVIKSIHEAINIGYNESDIVIASRIKKDLKPFKNTLHQDKIPYFEIYGDIKNKYFPGVRLSTFHGLKGLEFKLVYLINVNINTLPFRPHDFMDWEEHEKMIHDKSELSLMYVAISRAVERVFITGVGDPATTLNYLTAPE
jgi:hypothetical protein